MSTTPNTPTLESLARRMVNIEQQVEMAQREMKNVTDLMREFIVTNQRQLGDLITLVNNHVESSHAGNMSPNGK